MQITAAMVKELRERTGAGMMECKKALSESDGQMDAAIELMRKSGQAKADKKAGRVAAEGAIIAMLSDKGDTGVLLEVNCETDFVAKDEQFLGFCESVAKTILASQPVSVEALAGLMLEDGRQVEAARLELLNKIGENIQVRRFYIMKSAAGALGTYMHGSRIGVMVELGKPDDDLVKDIAMHIAASRPVCISEKDVAPELIDKEKEIFSAQAQASGKPAEIIEKMVGGRLKKFMADITLLGQPFVKDPDISVAKLLQNHQAQVHAFTRYEVGEGIEKKVENFADEVMKQVKGS